MQSQRSVKKVAGGYFRRRWRFWVVSFSVAAIAVPALVVLTVRGVSAGVIFFFILHSWRQRISCPHIPPSAPEAAVFGHHDCKLGSCAMDLLVTWHIMENSVVLRDRWGCPDPVSVRGPVWT